MRHARLDPGVERIGIQPHRLGLERDRKHAAVGAVLVAVDQHQATGKQLIEHRPPALLGRKNLALIEQDQFIGIGSQQLDKPAAKTVCPVNVAELFRHSLRKSMRIRKLFERGAHQRPAIAAWYMIDILPPLGR